MGEPVKLADLEKRTIEFPKTVDGRGNRQAKSPEALKRQQEGRRNGYRASRAAMEARKK
jgi:hypothetical protein